LGFFATTKLRVLNKHFLLGEQSDLSEDSIIENLLFYFILFYFILFHFILLYFIFIFRCFQDLAGHFPLFIKRLWYLLKISKSEQISS